ncbi:DUF4255 domain-containing protein [Microbacterium sp. dk485]|nr:DUF4255 domain-containing protein [Microbacterium sp. dk485]
MIGEVDDAIRAIVRTDAISDPDVDVVLDAPTTDWAARRNAPTVDLYLYDIREDTRRRENGFLERRDPRGIVVGRTPAPRYFKLSYLVTAWTQRPDDEHRLLDQLLQCFLRFDALPDEFRVGGIADTGQPVQITVGLPPPEDRAFADVWSSLGGELKPSLDLVVLAPVLPGVSRTAGAPVTEGVGATFQNMPDAVEERLFRAAAPDPARSADIPRTPRAARPRDGRR